MRTTMLVKLLMFGTHGDTAFHDIIKENYRCSNTPNFHWSYRGTWDNQTGSWNLCAICQWLLPRALPANRSRGRARFMSNQWPLSPQPVLCRVRRRKSTTRQNEGPDSIWILYGIPGCDYFYIIILTVKERRSKDYFFAYRKSQTQRRYINLINCLVTARKVALLIYFTQKYCIVRSGKIKTDSVAIHTHCMITEPELDNKMYTYKMNVYG